MNSEVEERRFLLTVSTIAFVSGITGSMWYSRKKATPTPNLLQQASNNTRAMKDARLFALKTLGLGTMLCLSGAGMLVAGVSTYTGARNLKEFSDFMKENIPGKVRGLRQAILRNEKEIPVEEELSLSIFHEDNDNDQIEQQTTPEQSS
ncbi:hypothetical protein K7432_012610 [Basidiobolus ranarum]|uniref:Transmembrane protein 242 n=1 Tax=Basidiobolus ranarum TaxID=34480 RepID=A0ABR2VSJ4_9FUNG